MGYMWTIQSRRIKHKLFMSYFVMIKKSFFWNTYYIGFFFIINTALIVALIDLILTFSGHRSSSFPHIHHPLRPLRSKSQKNVRHADHHHKKKKKKKKRRMHVNKSFPSKMAVQSPPIPEDNEEEVVRNKVLLDWYVVHFISEGRVLEMNGNINWIASLYLHLLCRFCQLL